MALIQVQKNGTTMQIDSANLSIWTNAGWTPVQPQAQQQPQAPAPPAQQAPQPQQPQQQAQQSSGTVDLAKYGAKQGAGGWQIDQSALNALNSDYDNLQPIWGSGPNGTIALVGYNGTLIPKATVVDPKTGQRVVVRTDNGVGKFRTLSEMQSQGYQLEKAPGVASGNTQENVQGAVDLSARPALKLPNGSYISPNDPKYSSYANSPGVQKVQQTDKQILNDNGRLYAWDGKTATYIQNVGELQKYVQQGYADTRQPYQSVIGGGAAQQSAQAGQQSGQYPSGGTSGGAVTPVSPEDKSWVNQLYQKYFDRDATSSELSNWAKETPQALEQFMQAEAKRYGYTSKYFQDTNNQKLKDALSIIDGSDLPPAIKDLWKTVVKGYPQGVEYNSQEILNTFKKVKEDTIDPHYRELANIAMNDFQSQLNSMNVNREMDVEQNRTVAGENIRQAKEGLEKSGMTFSGKAIEELGAQSAYAQPGTDTKSAIPEQTPFGGLFYEGRVNQRNRLMSSSTAARYNEAMQNLGLAAESKLGTSAAGALGIGYRPTGGVTGDLETQKQQQYGSTLNQIIDNYRQKQNLNTNQ